MEQKRICRLTYKSITAKRAKTFCVKPLKIFSHHDTIGGRIGLWQNKATLQRSSKPELVAWVLYLGHEARLTRPDWLVEKVAETVTMQFETYARQE